ncbi:UNVERIFIED_CONTAM: ALBINO3-like protein 1, chloroplastic [Sesamum calycinum]|uniref:ALBINO3-like protein 1, chloroplastic n=1 Tax=Sesamum calycinum TaxID=2727403 RepID=A0AAW2PNV2_9LAMI
MSTFLYSIGPNSVLSPFPGRRRTLSPVSDRTHFSNFTIKRPFLRGSLGVARFGLGQVPFPDPEDAELMMKDLFGRVEGFLYTVADAAVASSDKVDAVATTKQNSDWLSGITNGMEVVLKVESAMAMQSLAPQIKAIQERRGFNSKQLGCINGWYKSTSSRATAMKWQGMAYLKIGPKGILVQRNGCLPTLATIPIWIGLYRALSNVADEGLLTEGFFWIPSLSGPTTIAARQTGSGTSWLFPFIDGHPPLGWSDTLAYLVLPVLLIITQYISVQIMQPPQSNDPNVKSSQAITKVLPLMIGYFALSVPSGLSLYWFKQLKEQEARRKKQREEERRKAEEAATKGIEITNGEVKKDISPLETEDSQRATSGSSSSIDGLPVNGNSVSSEGKDDYKASIDNEVNSETPDDYKNRRDNLHLEKNIEKVPFPIPVFNSLLLLIEFLAAIRIKDNLCKGGIGRYKERALSEKTAKLLTTVVKEHTFHINSWGASHDLGRHVAAEVCTIHAKWQMEEIPVHA